MSSYFNRGANEELAADCFFWHAVACLPPFGNSPIVAKKHQENILLTGGRTSLSWQGNGDGEWRRSLDSAPTKNWSKWSTLVPRGPPGQGVSSCGQVDKAGRRCWNPSWLWVPFSGGELRMNKTLWVVRRLSGVSFHVVSRTHRSWSMVTHFIVTCSGFWHWRGWKKGKQWR